MNALFNTVLVNLSGDLTIVSVLTAMGVALALGALISLTYSRTKGISCQRNFVITLMMLPVILCAIILFVGSNVARAFSLAGTLSIIRFRSAPGDPKDIGYIFFDIAAGLSCGVGLYGYGIIFVILLCAVMLCVEKFHLMGGKHIRKTLKITIPEDLNYEGVFDDILKKYTYSSSLDKIRTTDLGSLFELIYTVSIKRGQNEQEMLNELRCRNGNLTIILTLAPSVES